MSRNTRALQSVWLLENRLGWVRVQPGIQLRL